MTEPTTAAGRALLYDPDEGYPAGLEAAMGRDATRWRDSLAEHILAIEAEARQDDSALRTAQPGDSEALHHAIGKALYGWGDDEPNEATGAVVRLETASVVKAVIEWLDERRAALPEPKR